MGFRITMALSSRQRRLARSADINRDEIGRLTLSPGAAQQQADFVKPGKRLGQAQDS